MGSYIGTPPATQQGNAYIGNIPVGASSEYADTPIGSIMAWPLSTMPVGWIECNGQITTAFPELASVVGTNVPDLRGEFIRGWDNGKGTDASRVLGSSQADDTEDLYAAITLSPVAAPNIFQKRVSTPSNYTATHEGDATSVSGASTESLGVGTDVLPMDTGETRPVNVALVYIIKAYNALHTGFTTILPANKNLIINPTFEVNQRVFAGGTVATTGTYIYDRWLINSAATCSVSTVAADGFVTISGCVSTNQGLQHRLPETREDTPTVTVSWEGTAPLTFYRANGSVYAADQTSPVTLTLATGLDSDRKEYFVWGNGTLKNPKIEYGSTPTPFENPDLTTEISKCSRYFTTERIYPDYVGFATKRLWFSYPVVMRVSPTTTITQRDVAGQPSTLNLSTDHGARFSWTTDSTGGFEYEADAEI